ncbi:MULTISPECIES: hypothetical protein [unclassified Methylobacterium]|uniref:hypothetical protein n=1 Tax=unclassified Methylobacterium TaxID=2615210 RepID=UPI0036FF2852
MKSGFTKLICFQLVVTQVGGCVTPYNLSSPEEGIPVSKILKSIKCEMITYLEANRQQRELFGAAYKQNLPSAYNHRYLDIADNLFAGVYVDLKEVDTKSLTVGFNRISRLVDYKSLTLAAGPSVSETDTFEVAQNFAVLQSARIYRPFYGKTSIPEHRPAAEDFDCYNSLPHGGDINFQDVSANLYGSNFKRIWVGSDQTLSQWLQNITVDMSKNYLTSIDSREIMAPGQISYSFALSYKLGIGGSYELIAQIWNPLSVTPAASIERTSTFRFIFNTNYAPIARAADTGAVGVDKVPCPATAQLADEDCDVGSSHGRTYLNKRGRTLADGAPISPSPDNRTRFDRKNNPSVFFTLPLGIPLTPSQR